MSHHCPVDGVIIRAAHIAFPACFSRQNSFHDGRRLDIAERQAIEQKMRWPLAGLKSVIKSLADRIPALASLVTAGQDRPKARL
jgi:hypothetical protein